MNSFGLITEGPTDQVVIENILTGYLGNYDILFNELQPLRDETSGRSEYGSWKKVFEYCSSSKFKQAFQYNEYIIIQIDTDVSEEAGYDVSKRDNTGRELGVEELIEKVIEKFIGIIGHEFYNKYSERIIFAVCVHMIECWLLPLYYTDNRKSKITGCLGTLNRELVKKHKFTIDMDKKNQTYYAIISKQFWRKKILYSAYKENPSFQYFIQHLEVKNVQL